MTCDIIIVMHKEYCYYVCGESVCPNSGKDSWAIHFVWKFHQKMQDLFFFKEHILLATKLTTTLWTNKNIPPFFATGANTSLYLAKC